ncbi:hypothetical protein M569_05583, partial [Genlisea aurea]
AVKHSTVKVNGVDIHFAEEGDGPLVLFLHGFPEFWYTWRHQLPALAAEGYRAVAPDLRGYGLSESPPDASSYSCLHVVGDIVGLINRLGGGGGAFVVAHDWGAMIAWYLCLFRPDLVKAYVALSVPFRPRNPAAKPVAVLRAVFGDDYYMCRFQNPKSSKVGSAAVIKSILSNRSPDPPRLPAENPFGFNDSKLRLPDWLTEEDLKTYSENFDRSGFTGGLNYYRALDLNWELTGGLDGAKVTVPVKLIVGELDMVYNMVGVKEYVHGGGIKRDVPLLEDCVVIPNAGHFINQEAPHLINSHVLDFIRKF